MPGIWNGNGWNNNFVTDPQRLPWGCVHESYGGFHYDDVGTLPRTKLHGYDDAAFWTQCAAVGDTAQVAADDTYVTITNVSSGSGALVNLILPGGTNIGDTVTVKITVDGVEYVLSFDLETVNDRFFAGAIERYNDYGQSVHTAVYPDKIISGIASHYETADTGNTSWALKSPVESVANSLVLRFESSLKVEMKSSDFDTTSNRDYCGVVYVLDQY